MQEISTFSTGERSNEDWRCTFARSIVSNASFRSRSLRSTLASLAPASPPPPNLDPTRFCDAKDQHSFQNGSEAEGALGSLQAGRLSALFERFKRASSPMLAYAKLPKGPRRGQDVSRLDGFEVEEDLSSVDLALPAAAAAKNQVLTARRLDGRFRGPVGLYRFLMITTYGLVA